MALMLWDKKILILTPSKCSSTTIRTTLCTELKAQAILGPQGPWREFHDFPDNVGKHSAHVPFDARNWQKYMMWRDPFDRFVSLWKHYCKYTSDNLSLERFTDLVIKWRNSGEPLNWFYWWKMSYFVREAGPKVGLIRHNDFDTLNRVLGTEIVFPKLHSTDHDDYWSYYTPELMRRVSNVA